MVESKNRITILPFDIKKNKNENDYSFARLLLGKDFISPEEVAEHRNISYSNEVIRYFIQTLPPPELLLWIRDNGFVLIAGPPKGMSLLEIRDLNCQLFCIKENGWYASNSEKFSRERRAKIGWIVLRKGIVPNSVNNGFSDQMALLGKGECILYTAEITWCETTHKEVRGEWLFPYIYTRTMSLTSDSWEGNSDGVIVGCSENSGINIGHLRDNNRHPFVGTTTAIIWQRPFESLHPSKRESKTNRWNI